MDMGLKGRRVLVTGGTQGIGRATAELLIAEGAAVAVAARSPAEAAAEIGAVPVAVDLGTAEGCADAVERGAAELGGGLDAVVNNVGAARIVSFEDVDDEAWQQSWTLNVLS